MFENGLRFAVECIEKKIFSEKSDVWATGVVMWECYTYAETPYSSVHFLQVNIP